MEGINKKKLFLVIIIFLLLMSFLSISLFTLLKDNEKVVKIKEKNIEEIVVDDYEKTNELLFEKGIEVSTSEEKQEKISGSQDKPKDVGVDDIDDSVKESKNELINVYNGEKEVNKPKSIEEINQANINVIKNKNSNNVYVEKSEKDKVKVNTNDKEVVISKQTNDGKITVVTPNSNTKNPQYEEGTTKNKNPEIISSNLPSEIKVTEKEKNKENDVMKIISDNVVDGYKIENIVVSNGFLIKDKDENIVQSYLKSSEGINNYQILYFDRKENINMLVENLFVLLNEKHTKESIKSSIDNVLKNGEVNMGNVLFYFYGSNIGVEWK